MYQKMLPPGGGSSGASSADKVTFNNEGTGLVSDNVQSAIEEVNEFLANCTLYDTNEKVVGKINVNGLDKDVYEKTIFIPRSEIEQGVVNGEQKTIYTKNQSLLGLANTTLIAWNGFNTNGSTGSPIGVHSWGVLWSGTNMLIISTWNITNDADFYITLDYLRN